MNIHWLLRLTHWVRHPPSPRRMALIASDCDCDSDCYSSYCYWYYYSC